jgi:hypothetical protein
MFSYLLTRSARRIYGSILLALLVTLSGCGSSSTTPQSSGPLSGNWQLTLTQNYPGPQAQLFASGFLQQTSGNVQGSVQFPQVSSANGLYNCGGSATVTGSVSGQTVNFTLNPGGVEVTFTGTISSDNTTMSGAYQGVAAPCFDAHPTSGLWSATLVPPVNGNFTGTITQSSYMTLLNGGNAASPINVTGTLTQYPSVGASAASLTGTISATGYPCLSTASLVGTISGQNVYLDIYDYKGLLMGTLGSAGTAAVAASSPGGGVTLSGNWIIGASSVGSTLPDPSPCPPIPTSGATSQTFDSGNIALTLQ